MTELSGQERACGELRVGSLFSGIGGLELERAGVGRTVWQVEIDPFCRQVLAKHWPDATRYKDITTIDWAHVEPVEVLCGGFPCQDISNAGKRAGLAGERSGLWREYARAVRALRPRYVVVENVAALLARGLGDVLADLAACGYDTEWDCVPAAAVGAPHRRDRLFLVAYPVDLGEAGHVADPDGGRLARISQQDFGTEAWLEASRRGDPDGCGADVAQSAGSGQQDVQGCEAGPEVAGRRAASGYGWWVSEPEVGRVVDGVRGRMDGRRLHALGNAVVPQVAEMVGRRLVDIETTRLATAA